MTEVPIHQAHPQDSQAIHACIMAAFAPYVASIEDFPDITHGLDECINKGEVFVAKSGEDVLGAMTIEVHDAYLKIGVVAVDPAHKGRGLGRKLVEFAEVHARTLGLAELRLKTHALMPQNVSLYEYLGWQVTLRESHAVSMARHLSDV